MSRPTRPRDREGKDLRQQGAADTGDDRRDERGGSKQPERQGERESLGDAQGRSRYQPRDPQNEAASHLKRLPRKYLAGTPAARDPCPRNHESVARLVHGEPSRSIARRSTAGSRLSFVRSMLGCRPKTSTTVLAERGDCFPTRVP